MTTSHHHNPWFALDHGHADEDAGEVWFGALAWSGNWKLSAEVTEFASTRLSLGVNDWDFAWRLDAGQSFPRWREILVKYGYAMCKDYRHYMDFF